MMIVSIAIQKGGSGKTTTTINLGAALRDMGKRVLLLDLDPQSNLTQSMGFAEGLEPNIYDVLKKEALAEPVALEEVIVAKNGLDIVPASLELAVAELELVSIYGRERVLSQLLQRMERAYDFILIDCPPSFGMLTVNALVASHYVLLPLQAEFLPLKGVRSFIRHFERGIIRLNPGLQLLGFVLTKYDHRKKMNRQVLEDLKTEFGPTKVFDTFIRANIALANAQEKGVDIFAYQKNANGAKDYRNLAEEFFKKIEAV